MVRQVKNILMRLVGWWRLWWGFCPWCNSSAPEIYECPCCDGYDGPHPPEPLRLEFWAYLFNRYMRHGYWRRR